MRFYILRTDFDLKFKFYSGYSLKFIGLNLSEFKNRAQNLTPFYELFLKTRRKNEQIRFIKFSSNFKFDAGSVAQILLVSPRFKTAQILINSEFL